MSDAAERLRLRYPPPRVPRPLLIALVAVGVVVGLVWLVWAALFHSTPAVAGQVSGFQGGVRHRDRRHADRGPARSRPSR